MEGVWDTTIHQLTDWLTDNLTLCWLQYTYYLRFQLVWGIKCIKIINTQLNLVWSSALCVRCSKLKKEGQIAIRILGSKGGFGMRCSTGPQPFCKKIWKNVQTVYLCTSKYPNINTCTWISTSRCPTLVCNKTIMIPLTIYLLLFL